MFKKIAAISALLSTFPLLAHAAVPQSSASSHIGSAAVAGTAFTLTASPGTGGTAIPARTTAKAGLQKPVKSFTFIPLPRRGVEAITGTYTTNTTYKYINALTGAEIKTLPAPIGARVKVVISNVSGDATLAGTFAALAANAGQNQSVLTGAPVTLNGRLSTGAGTYEWTQASGPAQVLLSGAHTSSATFTAPATTGVYQFRLTHGTSTTTTTVYVTNSAALLAKSECATCHAGQRVGLGIYTNWSNSAHKKNRVVCSDCHNHSGTAAHSFGVTIKTVDRATFRTLTPNVAGLPAAGTVFCTICHNGTFAIPHPLTGLPTTCIGCHTNGGDAHSIQTSVIPTAALSSCTPCHTNGVVPANVDNSCASCHASSTVHLFTPVTSNDCIGCHNVAQTHPGNYVSDNNGGVRAIVGEFGKWSHHVTGVTLNNAHCAACHLAGKVVAAGGVKSVVVDSTKHVVDKFIHLRNCADDSDYVWDPATPDFTIMDNFCMSCHSATGATSPMSGQIQAYINANNLNAPVKTASATNPFGDTISNLYDYEERPAVVDVSGQFNTGNNSHHAVKGKKYSGRTREAGPRQVANAAAFASNSSAAMPGARSTIYDSYSQESGPKPNPASVVRKFEQRYITLADNNTPEAAPRLGGTTLGDDSTLHCGDCHTVGQFAARGSVAFGNMSAAYWTQSGGTTGITRYNKGAIGAHGSQNEYLLRNNVGTDARHQGAETVIAGGNADNGTYGTKPYLVCFNCHAFNAYGTVTSNNGETGINHAGDYSKDARCNGPYNTTSTFTNMTGEGRLRSIGTATGAANYGKLAAIGQFYGNMFGIQCANCHNSGVKGNLFGGIHGSKEQTYTDGMGNTSKHFRFLPGLGNAMFVPGVKGGFSDDAALTTPFSGTKAVYKTYSGNRNGTGSGNSLGQTWTLLPVRTIRVTGVNNANGSYEYVTGGYSNDLNWEQRTQQSIAGQTDLQSKAMGCYTLSPAAPNYTYSAVGNVTTQGSAPTGQQKNPKVLALQAGGYPADDIRNAATTGLTAGDGREVFDIWGGCDDHNGAQGAGTGIVRKTLRKVSY